MTRRSTGEKIFGYVNGLFLIVFCITILYPFVNIIAISFSSTAAANTGSVTIFPIGFNIAAYKYLANYSQLLSGLNVTLFVTIVGTFLQLLFTVVTAYPLSRRNLPYRKFIKFFILLTMLFPPGIVQTYILFINLNLIDSIWVLILPGLIHTFNVIVMISFFETIPQELIEASRIDGLSEFKIIFKIIFPLSLAAISTIGLFYAVENWNAWFNGSIFINTREKWPLQLVLKNILNTTITDNSLDTGTLPPAYQVQMAMVFITTLPILLIYPFIQKYFVKGVMIGGIKG
ncbi:carbohydrate ABC transporter permease [Paenibacillus ginsengarvi]|uniref:Carbohydrate ABC transporter permease n=1 Tax=Paenibacillus ginsengarvi TaxID=400777 RepID=A0A3B0CJR4_9BACL|nr:carbohydrate ABC transporter permease [Paenibacillus ginsengarvi]RKN84519.1 carbohydrate ABC transporter permease [Paenibacillus ginsengarvi]